MWMFKRSGTRATLAIGYSLLITQSAGEYPTLGIEYLASNAET